MPKVPVNKKKIETTSPFNNDLSIFNKAKVSEAMKLLTYQKSYYVDHYSTALDKLNKSRSSGFLLFVSYSEGKKIYVNI
jgi:hypothetical protein